MQTKVMAANVSACNLFSAWLLYKLTFLLAQLSSAITSKLLAWFSWNLNPHSLDTLDNAEKMKKIWKSCKLSRFLLRGSHIEKHRKNCTQQQLGIKIDNIGLLRYHGRLNNADVNEHTEYPKLFHKSEHFNALLINEVHQRLIHAGVSHTLSQIR